MVIISFDEAIQQTKFGSRAILLGSGFSGAWDKKYTYSSLFDEAVSLSESSRKLFTQLNTFDFENVIRTLNHASTVCRNYGIGTDFDDKVNEVRMSFVATVHKIHDDSSSDISAPFYSRCADFLNHFDEIFTINYDLLLYWAILKANARDGSKKDFFKDGFGMYPGSPFLHHGMRSANVHFLHGALHIIDQGASPTKLRGGSFSTLKATVDDAIAKDQFPLMVLEGSSEGKISKIQSNFYLKECLLRLSNVANDPEDSFFSFGTSFNINDQHLLDAIKNSKCENFYFGLYSKVDAEILKIKRNVEIYLCEARIDCGRIAPNVRYFDAASATVWYPQNIAIQSK